MSRRCIRCQRAIPRSGRPPKLNPEYCGVCFWKVFGFERDYGYSGYRKAMKQFKEKK